MTIVYDSWTISVFNDQAVFCHLWFLIEVYYKINIHKSVCIFVCLSSDLPLILLLSNFILLSLSELITWLFLTKLIVRYSHSASSFELILFCYANYLSILNTYWWKDKMHLYSTILNLHAQIVTWVCINVLGEETVDERIRFFFFSDYTRVDILLMILFTAVYLLVLRGLKFGWIFLLSPRKSEPFACVAYANWCINVDF